MNQSQSANDQGQQGYWARLFRHNKHVPSDFTQSYNVRQHYNNYLASHDGTHSKYEELYKDTPIPRVHHAIIMAALKRVDFLLQSYNGQLPPDYKLRILDFGCADGRYRRAAYEVADILKQHNVKVEFLAYDIAEGGFESFKNKLEDEGFAKKLVSPDEKAWDNEVMCRDNLTVKFLLGAPEKPKVNAALIGNVDVSAAIFGVISHIPGTKNRKANLAMLKEITEGDIVITVPGHRILPEEHAQHKKLRAEKRPYKLAIEPNDLYYSRDRNIENFYHIYTGKKELQRELAGAGLKADISIAKLLHETQLTSNPTTLGVLDEAASYLLSHYLPENVTEAAVGYYLVEARDEKRAVSPLKRGGLAEGYMKQHMPPFHVAVHSR